LAWKTLLFLIILPLIVFTLVKSTLPAGNVQGGRFVNMFATTSTSHENTGSYDDIADYKRYYYLMDKTDRKEMALGKLRSELYYNFQDYLGLLIRKNMRLYRFGGDFSWSHGEGESTLFSIIGSGLHVTTKLLRIFLFFFGIMGLIHLIRSGLYRHTLAIFVIFCMFISTILSAIGEVNPNYSYLLSVHFVVFGSIGFVKFPELLKALDFSFKRHVRIQSIWIVRSGILVMAIAGLIFIISVIYGKSLKNSNLVYRDLRNASISMDPASGRLDQDGIIELPLQEKPLRFGMCLPDLSEKITASWEFKVTPGVDYVVRGFIRQNVGCDTLMKTSLIISDRLFSMDAKQIGKPKKLKIHDNYQVSYFCIKPVSDNEGVINLQMVLEAPEGYPHIGSPMASNTFLEFVQVSEIKLE
jgi:hypothetical protein